MSGHFGNTYSSTLYTLFLYRQLHVSHFCHLGLNRVLHFFNIHHRLLRQAYPLPSPIQPPLHPYERSSRLPPPSQIFLKYPTNVPFAQKGVFPRPLDRRHPQQHLHFRTLGHRLHLILFLHSRNITLRTRPLRPTTAKAQKSSSTANQNTHITRMRRQTRLVLRRRLRQRYLPFNAHHAEEQETSGMGVDVRSHQPNHTAAFFKSCG